MLPVKKRLWILLITFGVCVLIYSFSKIGREQVELTAKNNKCNQVIYRLINHQKSYKEIPSNIEHIQVKVTPPEIRGQPGQVLVETYNKTKTRIGSMSFELKMLNKEKTGSEELIVAAESKLPGGWGSAREWYKIKRPKTDIARLEIGAVEIYSFDDKEDVKKMCQPVVVDLIKN